MKKREASPAPALLHISKGPAGPSPLTRRSVDSFFQLLGSILSDYGGVLYAYCLSNSGNLLLLSLPWEVIGAFSHDLISRTAICHPLRQHREKGRPVGSCVFFSAGKGESAAVLSRRVHLFPYRNGLSPRPDLYRWSSFSSYSGGGSTPSYLRPGTILKEFGSDPAEQARSYAAYTLSRRTGSQPLISAEMLSPNLSGCAAPDTLNGVVEKVLRYYRVPSLRKNSRDVFPATIRAREMFVWIAKTYALAGDRGIAEKTGHSLSSAVPRLYGRTYRRLVSDASLLSQWEEEASRIMSGTCSRSSRSVS